MLAVTADQSYCPQCGSERQGALRYCAKCGFDYSTPVPPAGGLENAPAAPAQQPTAPVLPPAEKKKRSRMGCIAIGLIVLVVIVIIASLGNDPNATGDASPTPEASGTSDATAVGQPASSVAPSASTPPSAIPSLDPSPAFAEIPLSGTGSAVPRFDIPPDTAAIAVISHTGASNFAVTSLGEAGEEDLLVNRIGNYAGTVLFDETSGSHSVAFEVVADGPWTILIKPVTEAFKWDGTQQLAGSGDDVAIIDPATSGLKTATLTHQGDGNFAIFAYGPNTDLIVNEVGVYSGEVVLGDGTFLLEITANGPWTISPPQ